MDIQNITNLSTTHAQVALEAYVKYGSCQFHSNDKENSALTNATNGNGVFSGKSDISDTTEFGACHECRDSKYADTI
jgi:hypothetical protein